MGQGCRKGSPVNVSVSLLKAGFERGKGSKPGLPGCKTGITPLSSIELKPLKIIRAKFSPSGHGCTGWLQNKPEIQTCSSGPTVGEELEGGVLCAVVGGGAHGREWKQV